MDGILEVRLVSYVPAPGTGTREKMERLLAEPHPLGAVVEAVATTTS